MDDSISADYTEMNSQSFPHTRPVQIQEAKYQYVIEGQMQGNQNQLQGNNQGNMQNFDFDRSKLQNIVDRLQRQRGQYQAEQRRPYYAAGQGQAGMAGQGGQVPGQMTQPGTEQTPTEQVTPQQQAPTQQATPQQQAPTEQAAPQQKAPTTTQKAPTTQQTQQAKTAGISATEQKVIDLTNAERQKAGVKPLTGDTKLSSVARTKSNDMQAKGYFSHTSPTYGSPFDMMRDFGITYQTAGENIAQGQQTPEEVVRAWMNSEGHRKNILNPAFTHIGVGHDTTGNHWTQMFIGK
ncbi:CAP domain-containing protein [Neobacillus sp. D3-1R]|uniref:CAP domain-containing protein n=1 Tax=Neobacillus sp. D3-1R TaxID=3445778 RepID=UPI003FA030D8